MGLCAAAVETTTVAGKVLMPNGAVATGGTITVTLSQPGTTDDTTTMVSQRVGGRVVGTIGAAGDVTGIALVPNDKITPSGTYYTAQFSTTGPVRTSWTETWSVTTSPDPIDVGDITRLNIVPGVTLNFDNLSDVLLSGPVNGQILQFDAAAGQWENVSQAPDCSDPRVFCVGKQGGAEFSTICGMTPGVGGANSCGDATDVCAAGSAMAAAVAVANDPLNPVTVHVGPGRWNECIHIDPASGGVSTINGLVLDIAPGAIIRPAVTQATDVNNGVIRIAATTTARNSTRNVTIRSRGTCQNDATSAPEACLQAGQDGGPGVGNPSPWTDVNVTGGTWIGLHDGIQWFGGRLTTDDDPARISVSEVTVISGSDAVADKGYCASRFQNSKVLVWTNYCESTQTAFLAARGPSAASGTSSQTRTVRLQAADAPPAGFSYAGRKLTVTEGAGAGNCPDLWEGQWWISSSLASDPAEGNAATVTVSADPFDFATAECDYAIAAVTHNDGTAYVAGDVIDSPCQDFDWSTTQLMWKKTIFHRGIGTTATPVPDAATTAISGIQGEFFINDFGPQTSGGTCGQTQSHLAPFLFYGAPTQSGKIDSVASTMNLNVDTDDTENCLSAAIALVQGAVEDSIDLSNARFTLNNRGDPDIDTKCVVSSSPGTGGLRVTDTFCDLNNTVAGYSGTKTHIVRDETSTLSIGTFESDETIVRSGTMTLLSGASSTGSVAADVDGAGLGAGACAATTAVTVPGAATGDTCHVGPPSTVSAGIQTTCHVSAADTVQLAPCCNQAAACTNMSSATWRATVVRQ